MICPVCNSPKHDVIDLQSEGFFERIIECGHCETSWSINHGVMEVVIDTQANSFLEAIAECVEGDDYVRVA